MSGWRRMHRGHLDYSLSFSSLSQVNPHTVEWYSQPLIHLYIYIYIYRRREASGGGRKHQAAAAAASGIAVLPYAIRASHKPPNINLTHKWRTCYGVWRTRMRTVNLNLDTIVRIL